MWDQYGHLLLLPTVGLKLYNLITHSRLCRVPICKSVHWTRETRDILLCHLMFRLAETVETESLSLSDFIYYTACVWSCGGPHIYFHWTRDTSITSLCVSMTL